MPADDRPIVFLIYTRDEVPLRLDEAFLQANTNSEIHLITTERARYVPGNCDLSGSDLVEHRFKAVSDITEETVLQLISTVTGDRPKQLQVVTLSESSVHLTGNVKQRLGLINHDYSSFVRKDKMKTEASKCGMPIPKYVVFDRDRYLEDRHSYILEIINQLGLPCFIKPVDLYGSMETMKINSLAEFERWASKCMKDDLTYEIDEFITGTVYQCDSIICNGVTEFCQVSVGSRPWSEIYNGHNIGVRTVKANDAITNQIIQVAKNVNRHFMDGLSGITCLEVFVRGDEIVFLEIAYRPPGAGLSSSPYFLRSSNIHINESHILAQTSSRWRPQAAFMNHVAWVIVPLPLRSGTLKEICVPDVDCEIEVYWNIEPGTDVETNDGINKYAGGILLWSDSYEKLAHSYEHMLKTCRLEVETAS
jgi:hypothetical protein